MGILSADALPEFNEHMYGQHIRALMSFEHKRLLADNGYQRIDCQVMCMHSGEVCRAHNTARPCVQPRWVELHGHSHLTTANGLPRMQRSCCGGRSISWQDTCRSRDPGLPALKGVQFCSAVAVVPANNDLR